MIVSGCADHKIHFWDAVSGEPNGPALGHGGLIAAAAVSGDGSIVLTGSWDRTARMWDVRTRRSIGPRVEFKDSVHSVAIATEAPTCIAGSFDGTARVWELPTETKGDVSRIALWCEVITGMELDAQRLRSRARCGDLERSASCARATRRAAHSLTMAGEPNRRISS